MTQKPCIIAIHILQPNTSSRDRNKLNDFLWTKVLLASNIGCSLIALDQNVFHNSIGMTKTLIPKRSLAVLILLLPGSLLKDTSIDVDGLNADQW